MRGPISIAISGAIGLATEAVAAVKHKDNKTEHEQDHESDDSSELDHEEWILDETQAHLETNDNSLAQEKDFNTVDGIVQEFVQLHPQPHTAIPSGTYAYLTNPVIIPQRRPHSKTRGFVRAYAPVLETRGIDQMTFLDFLKGFDKSIKKQGLFMVANVAVGAGVIASKVMIGENFFVDLAAFAVHTTVEMGRRMYVAKKLNTYLLDMNEQVFKPRGLYALIMAYKPKDSDAVELVDLDLDTSVALSAAHDGKSGSKFRVDSGATWDESQMPVAAPLIFPALQSASEEDKQNAFKKASSFYSDYNDRRAQAVFSEQNPDSSLNVVPQKKFASRYADPNHPVNKGGPLAILTGGKLSIDNKRREKREQENLAKGLPKDGGKKKGGIAGLKRKLQENVLYLLIVDMPTPEQLERAAALEAAFKGEEKH